jgi:hypothetical protein
MSGQGVARHELEHEAPDSVGLLEAVDRADLRVIERGQHTRFAFEACQPVGIVGERPRQNLDRDGASELRVSGAIYLPHTPDADPIL